MALPRQPPPKVVFTVGPDGVREVAKAAPGASASDATKPGAKQGEVVKVRRETQGRRGKTVTTVSGISARPAVLDEIATALKQKCGAGGAVKDGVIEIQGDHREKVKVELEARGYVVKFAGG
jgi:translation initiation factor 1